MVFLLNGVSKLYDGISMSGVTTQYIFIYLQVQGLVLKKIEGALDTLARNSTQTFAACLEDVEFVARNLLNFSEWAFKSESLAPRPC